MTCVTTGGTSYGYSYDGDGRRVSSDTRNGCNGTPQASSITRYAWDELSAYGDVVAELNSTNTTATMLYIVGDGTVLAQQAGTSAPARFLLHDGQGSTRSLLDNGGTLLENYVYDAFGTLKAPTGTPQTRYLYTGQQFDAATKLYSLRARSYNPAQGRFTARDTASVDFNDPRELNRYGYTANNPINSFDPFGYNAEEYSQLSFFDNSEGESTAIVGQSSAQGSGYLTGQFLINTAKSVLRGTIQLLKKTGKIAESSLEDIPLTVVVGVYIGQQDEELHFALAVSTFFDGPESAVAIVARTIINRAKASGWKFIGGEFESGETEHAEEKFIELMDDLAQKQQVKFNSIVPAGVSRSFCSPYRCGGLGTPIGSFGRYIIRPLYKTIIVAPPKF